jgi:4-hydroxyphenylpyruvate dioxygenase
MLPHDALRLIDFDSLEFAVSDLDKVEKTHLRLGFERTAVRENKERKLTTLLMTQGQAAILLSYSADPKDPVSRFVQEHGDGIVNVTLRCEDAVSALEVATGRGAQVAESPHTSQKDFGSVTYASIKAYGDVRHTFLSRTGELFGEGFDSPVRLNHRGSGLTRIDHITTNVEKGKMDEWAAFYEKIFGFQNVRFFDIHTKRTGLYSKVMQSTNGVIKVPINEPTEAESQIQEFIDTNHGPGVQHVALSTSNIMETLPLLKRAEIPFLDAPPHTYYEDIPKRTPQVTENLNEVERMSILIDGDTKGYLLQIFTQNLIGPFFYEVIQRKGNDGFGEGNFGALFEAIERDQIRRGVLKP